MSNRILIDATYMQQELRAAVVNNGTVNHLDIEAIAKQQTKAYIYKGKVTRIEPSLEACFVDYGAERHGFLPLKDIAPQYHQKRTQSPEQKEQQDTNNQDQDQTNTETDQNQPTNQNNHYNHKLSIRDMIKEGQELIVQVEKVERGNKGAALTTYITLAGSYLVLMPNNPKAGGVSRRIEGEERSELLSVLKQLNTPSNMGIIIRTASVGKSLEELQWDLDVLVNLWQSIEKTAAQHDKPILIHQESNAMIRVLRDYLRQETDEIIINDHSVYLEAKKYIECIRPNFTDKVKFHDGNTPLFTQYHIEKQVSSIFNREVRLPSGGSIVIDINEALVAIDINSAKATKGGDIEETALNTNLEAASEIARQLRLRDLGGLIVIDFIDMNQTQNQREVEERLRIALLQDRAKVQIGKISRFGLLEMSRQRLRATLAESTKLICPHCQGHGLIRSIPSLSLAILRAIEAAACESHVNEIRAHLPIEVATFLLNDQRDALKSLEQKFATHILLIPNVHMTAPNYEIERLRQSSQESETLSYQLASDLKKTTDKNMGNYGLDEQKTQHQPALKTIELPEKKTVATSTSGSNVKKASKSHKTTSLLGRIFKAIFLGSSADTAKKAQKNTNNRSSSHRKNNRYRNKNKNYRQARSNSNQGNKRSSAGNGNNKGNYNNRNNNNRRRNNNNGNRPNSRAS